MNLLFNYFNGSKEGIIGGEAEIANMVKQGLMYSKQN